MVALAIGALSVKLLGFLSAVLAYVVFMWLQPKRGATPALVAAVVVGLVGAVVSSTVLQQAIHGPKTAQSSEQVDWEKGVLTPPQNTQKDASWTQESTRSTEAGPWLDFSPPGARFCRAPDGTIFTVFPPGAKPDAPIADPACLSTSVASAKQL